MIDVITECEAIGAVINKMLVFSKKTKGVCSRPKAEA
jgi:hypothetical protein